MSSLDFTDTQLVSGMRRLRGQICTPPGFLKDLRDEILRHDLMRFHEWPSGHWSYTDKGRNFLSTVEDAS